MSSKAVPEPRRELFFDREIIVWTMVAPLAAPFLLSGVSHQAISLLGYEIERWLEPDFWIAIQKDEDRERAIQICRAVWADREPRSFSHCVVKSDGSAVPFVTTILASAGAPGPSLTGVMRPASREREAASVVARGLEHLLGAAPVALFALDPRGVITLSEGRALEALGLRPGETVGRSVFEMYRDEPEILEAIRAALAGNAFTSTGVVQAAGRSYETRWMPFHDDCGALAGTLGIAWDVTATVEAGAALRYKESIERIILDSVPAFIWFKDDHNRIIKCNEAAAASVGLTRAQIEGRRTEELFPAEAAAYFADDLEVMRSGTPKVGIIEPLRIASGEKRWISTNKVPYRDPAGKVVGVIVSATDITPVKLAQEERNRLLVEERNARAAAEAAVHRLEAVQAVTEVTISSDSVDRLIGKALEKLREVFAADLASLLLVDVSEKEVVVRAESGIEGGGAGIRIPLTANLPGRVIATRKPVVIDEITPADVRPLLLERGFRSIMGAPLNVGERTIGLATVGTRVSRKFTKEDVALLELVADRIALAIEQARLREVERTARLVAEDAARRAAFLAEASTVLASSLDYEKTIESAVRLALPLMADWCVLDLVDDAGTIRRAAFVAPDRDQEAARAITGTLPDLAAPEGPARVIRTGEAAVYSVSEADYTLEPGSWSRVFSTRDPDYPPLLGKLGLRTFVSVPLSSMGRTFGALTFCSTRPGRYVEADVALARELAGRVALAAENARFFREADRALAAAREAVRLRDEFLSIASHELRTPLTSLRLAVQGTLRLTERGDLEAARERVIRSLRIVERQSLRLTNLVNALLDATRITSGHLALDLGPVDLGAVVVDVLEIFKDELILARCPVTLDCRTGVIGQWDRSRVEQIVTNLISNAMKYGAGCPIDVSVRVQGERATLLVRDRGIGIDVVSREKIFERFKRGVSPRHFGGLGLGLYIVRQIAEALGGSVRVESQEGAGSTFAVELPLAGPAAATLRAA